LRRDLDRIVDLPHEQRIGGRVVDRELVGASAGGLAGPIAGMVCSSNCPPSANAIASTRHSSASAHCPA